VPVVVVVDRQQGTTSLGSTIEWQDPQQQQQQRHGKQFYIADSDCGKMPTGEIGLKATIKQLQQKQQLQ